MLATSKGTNADSDEALRAPELAQESVVTVPLMLSTSVFPAIPSGKKPPAEAHNNVTDPEGHELQLHKAEGSVP